MQGKKLVEILSLLFW